MICEEREWLTYDPSVHNLVSCICHQMPPPSDQLKGCMFVVGADKFKLESMAFSFRGYKLEIC